jgi:hypothetical protein
LGQKSLYLFILPSTNKSLHETDRPRVNLWNLNCAIRLPFFHLCRLRSLSVVKLLIGELKEMTAGDEQYDAKYTVLSENVKYHIQEEESGLFPSLKANLMRKNLGRKWKLVNRNFNDSFTNLRGAPNQKTRTRKRKGRQTAAKKARRKATGGRR